MPATTITDDTRGSRIIYVVAALIENENLDFDLCLTRPENMIH